MFAGNPKKAKQKKFVEYVLVRLEFTSPTTSRGYSKGPVTSTIKEAVMEYMPYMKKVVAKRVTGRNIEIVADDGE